MVDRFYDPVAIIGRKLLGIRKRTKTRAEEAGTAPGGSDPKAR